MKISLLVNLLETTLFDRTNNMEWQPGYSNHTMSQLEKVNGGRTEKGHFSHLRLASWS